MRSAPPRKLAGRLLSDRSCLATGGVVFLQGRILANSDTGVGGEDGSLLRSIGWDAMWNMAYGLLANAAG